MGGVGWGRGGGGREERGELDDVPEKGGCDAPLRDIALRLLYLWFSFCFLETEVAGVMRVRHAVVMSQPDFFWSPLLHDFL